MAMPRIEIEQAEREDLLLGESSTESFDRIAFAARALELLGPRRTTIALCAGTSRVRLEAGRAWGKGPDARWAILFVPPRASRRAIAIAVASLGGAPRTPYAFDILLNADLL